MRDSLFAFVVNAVWQSTLIASLGLASARLLRGARQRFELLALTLAAAVAAPLLTLAPQRAATTVAAIDLAPVQSRGGGVIAFVYLAGLAFFTLRFLMTALRARRLLVAAIPFRGRMRLSDAIEGPVTIGRTVLLPSRIAADRTLVRAALAHEHAHVRRHDYLLHVALELLALPLYFHPLAALLRRAIAEAREMACDEDAAARRGRKQYAEALVRLACVASCGAVGFSPPALRISMAETSIERRVAALLTGGLRGRRSTRILLILPLIVAAACTRFSAAPANLCGRWALVAEASNVRYDAFTQTIEQGPAQVAVRQQRTARGRTRVTAWKVITDGLVRPIDGVPNARGSAIWKDGKLHLQLAGPGAHRETGTAFIRDGRLVCDVRTESSSLHAEFRRIDP
jgi:hypothetical protein